MFGTGITGGGSEYAALLANAEGALYGVRYGTVCFYYCRPITKLFTGGGEWRTCAMRDDEPRPVWMSLLAHHALVNAGLADVGQRLTDQLTKVLYCVDT